MKTLFNFIPRLAWALADKNSGRLVVVIVRLYYFVISRKLRPQLRIAEFKLAGSYKQTRLNFYLQVPMDIAVLVEVFVFKEYEWKLDQDPEVIVDLGAHFGDTALYYHAVYPNAKIIAVEPAPDNFARLQRHVAHIENIIPVQAAVGGTDGTINLHMGASSLGHSLVQRSKTDQLVSVRQVSLATLYAEHNIQKANLLKFDIEGAEFALLESINVNTTADAYIGELHFDLNGKYNNTNFDYLVPSKKIIKVHIYGERYMVKF